MSALVHRTTLLCLLLVPRAALAQPRAPAPAEVAPVRVGASASRRVLTLAEALSFARANQPALRRARAQLAAARARVSQARAPLFPQVDASAGWQKTTANFAARPGATPQRVAAAEAPDFDLYDFFNFELSARQLIWDFGRTTSGLSAAAAERDAQAHDERTVLAQVEEDVRVRFFEARSAQALVAVARETLENYEQHLRQTEAFVRAGTRAEIDLAQARTNRANARVDLINAENAYATAKARLNLAMGRVADTDYEVADESLPPVDGEDAPLDRLVQRALAARPELAALDRRIRAQELTVSSIRGGHWPTLSAFTEVREAGVELDAMAWNWAAGVVLNWPLFRGGQISAQVDEASANLSSIRAQLDELRQQVRLEVDQSRLALRAAKAVIEAADEAIASARERLRLAEGRYQAGVGSALELSDAQLEMAAASAQRVQAEYELSAARARLIRVLGP